MSNHEYVRSSTKVTVMNSDVALPCELCGETMHDGYRVAVDTTVTVSAYREVELPTVRYGLTCAVELFGTDFIAHLLPNTVIDELIAMGVVAE